MADPAHQCRVRLNAEVEARFAVRPGHRVLHEMIKAGGQAPDGPPIPVGCRGGGCGVCRVRVLSGEYATKRMSRAHVSEADEAEGVVLACRLLPASDIVVVPEPGPPTTSTSETTSTNGTSP